MTIWCHSLVNWMRFCPLGTELPLTPIHAGTFEIPPVIAWGGTSCYSKRKMLNLSREGGIPPSLITGRSKLQNFSEISWFVWFFWLVFVLFKAFLVLFEGRSPLRKCLNFDGLSRQLGNTSSWIVQRLVTDMKHLLPCLAERSSFVFSQQARILLQVFENIAITGKFR